MTSAVRRLELEIGSRTDAPNVALLAVTLDGTITWATRAASTVLGQPIEAIIGADLRRLFGQSTTGTAVERLGEGSPGSPVAIRVQVRRPDGQVAQLVGQFEQLGPDAPLEGVLVTLADVTATMELQDAYTHSLLHDPQTGLVNRMAFDDRLREAVTRSVRSGAGFGLVLGHLDRFQDLHLSHGAEVGDVVLDVVGARIRRVARDADTCARTGVDRVAMILHECGSLRDAEMVTGRLQQSIRAPLEIDDQTHLLTLSCGVSIFEPEEADASIDEMVSSLVLDAEMAMRDAARQGAGARVVTRPELREANRRRTAVEKALVGAVDRDELILHYQPIFDLQTMGIVGVEALVRWHHAELGIVSPGEFIPLAEANGQIVRIGSWVLQEACRQVAHWNQRFPSEAPVHVSINVSAHQLSQTSLAREVALALAVSGTAEHTLTLELTESALVRDRDVASRTLTELHDLGVRLALDDFGTGMSLEHLQMFRFDEIKIERQFAAVDGGAGETLADALINFGRSLDVITVAEGIEDREQLERFRRLGCDRGQGFFLGRPAVGVEVEALLAARASQVRTSSASHDPDKLDAVAVDVDQLLRDLAKGR